MELLNPSDYPSIQPLLADAPHDLAVSAVAAGGASGTVYTDGGARPSLALLYPHFGRLYVLGRCTASAVSQLRTLLQEVVRPAATSAGARVFTLNYPADWQTHAPEALGAIPSVSAERQYYQWAGTSLPQPQLPEGFTLVAADRSLMLRTEVANLDLLAEEMASERESEEEFLSRSYGIAALHGQDLAGWCLSEYNYQQRCEVGIASLEPFQRCGLATAMGRAFLEAARARGVQQVGWHCWKKNVPSAAAARKIGFELVADYPVYFGWYNEADAPH